MHYNVIEVHDNTTIASIDNGQHRLLEVGRRIYKSELQSLVTKGTVLRHEPAVLDTILPHRHVVIARFQVQRAKTRGTMQPTQAILQVWGREPIQLGPRINGAEISAQPVCLSRLRRPIRPPLHQHHPVQMRRRRRRPDNPLLEQRIRLLLHPTPLLQRILYRPLPDNRSRLDFHAEWVLCHKTDILLRGCKARLQMRYFAKVRLWMLPRTIAKLDTTKHIERALPRFFGRIRVEQIMLSQPRVAVLPLYLPS